jgi:hypothetical protein
MANHSHLGTPDWLHTNFSLAVAFVVLAGVADALGQGLPSPWQSRDIGAVGTPGNGSFDFERGVWTVSGAGADIWGTSDAFHYVYRPLTGDGGISAVVTSIGHTHSFAKAGLMIRESLAPESRHVTVNLRPNGSYEFLTRLGTAGSTFAHGGPGADVPRSLLLIRKGDQIEAFVQLSNDSYWTSVWSQTIGYLAQTLYVGLAVTSHDAGALNTSTFESLFANDLRVVTDLPDGWTKHTIGESTRGGAGYRFDSNTFRVVGTGADIWGTSDGFQYVSQPVDGDREIVVRVTDITNTHPYAKAGVMLRESLTPNSAHVILDVKPDGGIEFMTRSSEGANTSFIAGATATAPRLGANALWLRLVRSGTNVTGYVSDNGIEWSTVGRTETTMARSAHIGMVVTSHVFGRSNESLFDNVFTKHPSREEIVVFAAQTRNRHGGWHLASDLTAAGGKHLANPDSGYAALGAPLATPAMYFDAVFHANAGTPYTVWLRLRAPHNSKWNDSVWVQFSDALVNGSPAYPIDTTTGLLINLATDSTASSLNGWGWANGVYWLSQPATVTFGSTGLHTIRIQVREDGVELDQIVLSSSEYLTDPPGPPTNDHTIVPTD